jgi:C4-dicarboxylate transporter DctM subunit
MDLGFLAFFLFLFLIFIGMPLAYSLGFSAIVGMILLDIPIFVLPQRLNEGVGMFPFTAVPLFFLAGELMAKGGVSDRLINFASILLGRFTGGLAMVTVAACMFFAGVSGAAIADTAAIASIMIPAMVSAGYDARFATVLSATSGSIGPIIPPSVPMVIYAVIASASVGELFMAGVVPGILMGVSLMIISYIVSKRHQYRGVEQKATFGDFYRAFRGAALALGMPLIIVGGIISGVFTATEAAVIAVVYSLLLGFFVYRELKLRDIPRIFANVAIATGSVMFIVSAAAAFVWVVTYVELPQKFAQLVASFATSKVMLLLILNIILLIVGMVIDTTSAIIIFTPLLLPVALKFGVDEIHFGIVMMVNLTIGMCTPPFALCIFVACSISKLKINDVFNHILYMVPVLLVILVIITYFPQTWRFMTALIN